MRYLAIAATMAVVSLTGTVRAEEPFKAPMTIQDLYQDCKSASYDQTMLCLAFIQGAAGMQQLAGVVANTADNMTADQREALVTFSACHPAGVTFNQMKQVFINWAEKHPGQWQDSHVVGVALALKEAWPCK